MSEKDLASNSYEIIRVFFEKSTHNTPYENVIVEFKAHKNDKESKYARAKDLIVHIHSAEYQMTMAFSILLCINSDDDIKFKHKFVMICKILRFIPEDAF